MVSSPAEALRGACAIVSDATVSFDYARRVVATQLDERIGDTFASVGTTLSGGSASR
jgi:hypothetical protein